LRRSASGPFEIGTAHTLEALASAAEAGEASSFCITPFAALAHLPDLPVTEAGLVNVSFGRSPHWHETTGNIESIPSGEGLARLSHNGMLIAVARLTRVGEDVPTMVLKRVFAS
jgi:tRNA pseudouridine55 synthase